jgi:ribosomal-protein-alanine N-acetyltransferase
MQRIKIELEHLTLRSLTTNENLDNYLYWMSHPDNNEYILSASESYSLNMLRQYIDDCNSSDSTILLGIFDRRFHLHIGNIKYEKIDLKNGTALMGILIGEKLYRGRGLGKITIEASLEWLSTQLELRTIYLGVHPLNTPAIKLYKKIGFVPEVSQIENGLLMSLNLNPWKKFD